MSKLYPFSWSDNLWIENRTVWFIDGEKNILYKSEMDNPESVLVAEIPDARNHGFRLFPRCMKYENQILCMPDRGNCIWIYDLKTSLFSQIKIDNPHNRRINIQNFWRVGKILYAVAIGLARIIEIDIPNKKIIGEFDLTDDENERIALSSFVGKCVYSVSATSNQVYKFDIETKEISEYILPDIEGGLRTICFDGNKFWLSGYRKELYVWNALDNTIQLIKNFPKTFGIYNFNGEQGDILLDCETDLYKTPTFIDSIVIGNNVWFIPYETNEIIYVNRDSFELSTFKMEGETETETSLFSLKRLRTKYLLEAVFDSRYLILFSNKNNYIIYIDTLTGNVRKRDYEFNAECMFRLRQLKRNDCILYERAGSLDLYVEQNLLKNGVQQSVNHRIGKTVYEMLK